MADVVWPGNYISFYYESFKKHAPNANLVQNFYSQKGAILANQLNIAQTRKQKLLTQVKGKDPGLYKILLKIVNPNQSQNFMQQIFSELEKEAPAVSVTGQTGLAPAPGQYESTWFNLPTTLATTRKLGAKWTETATILSDSLEQMLASAYTRMGIRGELQAKLLAQKAHGGTLTSEEENEVAFFYQQARLVQSPKSAGKLEGAIKDIEQSLIKLQKSAGLGMGRVSDAVDIAKVVKAAALQLQASQEELVLPLFLTLATLEGFSKHEKMFDDKIKGAFRRIGDSPIQYTETAALQSITAGLPGDIKNISLPQIQGKPDTYFKFQNNTVTFSLYGSAKTASQRSLGASSWGVGFLDTSLIVLLDRLKIFNKPSLVNAIMNTAAGFDRTNQADLEWYNLKQVVAASALLIALTGTMRKDSRLLFLTLNGRVYLIDDVVNKVINAISIGGQPIQLHGWIDRGKYVQANVSSYKGTSPNYEDALERSGEVYNTIIKMWRSQSVKVSLLGLKYIL